MGGSKGPLAPLMDFPFLESCDGVLLQESFASFRGSKKDASTQQRPHAPEGCRGRFRVPRVNPSQR